MIDKLIIKVKAGNGGKGFVSFNRDSNNSRGGPDGGHGGNGGNIILKANSNLEDLFKYKFKKNFLSENGKDGSKQNKSGAKGEDLFLELPVGCLVWEIKDEERKLIASILDDSTEVKLFLGGIGGKGNTSFVSSQNKEPLLAEAGQIALTKTLELDLRISSDLVLLGPPNVGKSTFISFVSNAKPEIKDYPFTTREPVVAVSKINYSNIKIVELPSVLNKKGPGLKFLKHIYGAKSLCLTVEHNEQLDSQIQNLLECISYYDEKLMDKKFLVLITKSELLSSNEKNIIIKKIMNKFAFLKVPPFFFSNNDSVKKIEILEYVQKDSQNFENLTREEMIPTITINNAYTKVIKNENSYEILDKNFVQLADGSDLNNRKALVQFQYRLKNSNISKALQDIGIQKGDKLIISNYEFTWEE